jgi:hypothetical protein
MQSRFVSQAPFSALPEQAEATHAASRRGQIRVTLAAILFRVPTWIPLIKSADRRLPSPSRDEALRSLFFGSLAPVLLRAYSATLTSAQPFFTVGTRASAATRSAVEGSPL